MDYLVEVGKHDSSYHPKYSFTTLNQAWLWYSGINVHSGGKKRLTRNGELLHRVITTKGGGDKVTNKLRESA